MARPSRDTNASVQRQELVDSANGVDSTSGGEAEESVVVSRPTQNPVVVERNRLTVKGLDQENFFYRWALDVDDRIPYLLEAGYTFVLKEGKQAGDRDANYSQNVGSYMTKSAGGGKTYFLMRIPKEFWEARQAAMSQARADAWDNHIQVKVKAKNKFVGGIKITRK